MKGVALKLQVEDRKFQLDAKVVSPMKQALGQISNLQAEVAAVQTTQKHLKRKGGCEWKEYMDPWGAGPKAEACVKYVKEAVRVRTAVENWVVNYWDDAVLQAMDHGHVSSKAVSNLRHIT